MNPCMPSTFSLSLGHVRRSAESLGWQKVIGTESWGVGAQRWFQVSWLGRQEITCHCLGHARALLLFLVFPEALRLGGRVASLMTPENDEAVLPMGANLNWCRNPTLKKELSKKARKSRREFDARMGALPRGKIVWRPVVKKLWVLGRASEDREEWMEEISPLRKMPRRQGRYLGTASGEDSRTTV